MLDILKKIELKSFYMLSSKKPFYNVVIDKNERAT
jgi:hypothetical protein